MDQHHKQGHVPKRKDFPVYQHTCPIEQINMEQFMWTLLWLKPGQSPYHPRDNCCCFVGSRCLNSNN
eukprot:4674013-Prorocentrum_lima.AAC.1